MAGRLLTVKEVGERLGTKLMTTYRLIHSGALPHVDISRPGKRKAFRVSEADIEAFIAQRRRRGLERAA